MFAAAAKAPQARSRLGAVALIGSVLSPMVAVVAPAQASNGGGGLPKVTVSVPLVTAASWVVAPPSSNVSYTKTFSEVVPAGMRKGAPPKVVPEPEPVKVPPAAVVDGWMVQKAVVEPATSTRILNSLR